MGKKWSHSFYTKLMLCDKNTSHNCDKESSIGILSMKFTPIINVVMTIQPNPGGPYSEFD